MPFSESMHTVAELQYLSLHGGGSAAVGPWKGRYREQALRHANPFGNLNDNLPLGQAPCTEWTKCLRLTISDEGCIVYSLEGHVDCSLAAMISVILTGLAVLGCREATTPAVCRAAAGRKRSPYVNRDRLNDARCHCSLRILSLDPCCSFCHQEYHSTYHCDCHCLYTITGCLAICLSVHVVVLEARTLLPSPVSSSKTVGSNVNSGFCNHSTAT